VDDCPPLRESKEPDPLPDKPTDMLMVPAWSIVELPLDMAKFPVPPTAVDFPVPSVTLPDDPVVEAALEIAT